MESRTPAPAMQPLHEGAVPGGIPVADPRQLCEAKPRVRILVVDDNESIRRIIRRNLEHAGYAVVTACNGGSALSTTSSAMSDPLGFITLVLTDIDMPGVGGIRLGQELTLRWPKVLVIYMSGTTLGLRLRAQLPAHAHFMEKPFGAKALLEKVEIVLSLAAKMPDEQVARVEEPGDRTPL